MMCIYCPFKTSILTKKCILENSPNLQIYIELNKEACLYFKEHKNLHATC